MRQRRLCERRQLLSSSAMGKATRGGGHGSVQKLLEGGHASTWPRDGGHGSGMSKFGNFGENRTPNRNQNCQFLDLPCADRLL